jgi:hypothetical protein
MSAARVAIVMANPDTSLRQWRIHHPPQSSAKKRGRQEKVPHYGKKGAVSA